jgi:hypothetical protein
MADGSTTALVKLSELDGQDDLEKIVRVGRWIEIGFRT